MATDQEVRRVLREEGIEVTARGKLSDDYHDRYEAIMEARGDGGAAAVGPADGGDDAAGATPATPERRPRRSTPRGKPRTLWQRIQAGAGAKPGGKRRKDRHPRVPVDRVCSRLWEMGARLAGPTPLGRCLAWQSDVAGLVLEDVVADTIVDRGLQPIARAEQKAGKMAALLGPPVFVGALQAAQGLPPEQRAVREAFLVPMLRESLVLAMDVAGDKIEARAEREAEQGPKYEAAERVMAMMFAPPSYVQAEDGSVSEAEAAAAAEDAAARAAQAFASA